jgi:hypothetical protein
LTSSLPAFGFDVFDEVGGDSTAVALLPYGKGTIVYLAWDWYDSLPTGRQDSGWNETLGDAILTRFDLPPRIQMNQPDKSILEDTYTGPMAFTIFERESTSDQVIISATASNSALFPAKNIFLGGTTQNQTITLMPAPNQFGTSVVTITVIDSIGQSASKSLVVQVIPVNDPPFFTRGSNVTAAEDAGAVVLPNWATGIAPGPTNESNQIVSFLVSNDVPSLFAEQPTVDSSGTLRFTVNPDLFGITHLTIRAEDDGGTENNGRNNSTLQTFTISVTSVNDPPVFTKGPDITILEDAGEQVLAGWASGIRAGPANETGSLFASW